VKVEWGGYACDGGGVAIPDQRVFIIFWDGFWKTTEKILFSRQSAPKCFGGRADVNSL